MAINLRGLIDTRASSFNLIHPRHMRTIKKGLKPTVHQFKPIPLARYNSRLNGQVNEYFSANLVLDGHQVPTFFIFCNTGYHDIIVSRKLLKEVGV
jgi:hypothetical protein